MRHGLTGVFGLRREQIVAMLAAGQTVDRVAAEIGSGAGAVEAHLHNARLNASVAELSRR